MMCKQHLDKNLYNRSPIVHFRDWLLNAQIMNKSRSYHLLHWKNYE